MAEDWTRGPLGAFVALDIDRVPVEPGRDYLVAGVLNAGQGLFAREAIDASSTNYLSLHRLHAGQLVMRKLTAWEGPITCVPDAFDGYYVSAEFPTFTIGDRLLPGYMTLMCQRPDFWEAMKDRSTGSVQRRKRVSPSELLSITVSVPPIPEQRRIIDLAGEAGTVGDASTSYERAGRRLVESIQATLWLDHAEVEFEMLGASFDVSRKSIDPATLSSHHMLTHYSIPSLAATGGPAADRADSIKSPKFMLDRPSVLLSLLNPRITRCYLVDGGHDVVSSTEFAVLRPRSAESPSLQFLYAVVSSAGFRDRLVGQVAGTTGSRQRVRPDDLMRMEIPVPPMAMQDVISATVQEAVGLSEAAGRYSLRARALRSALLTDLLSGEHEIPASYDRFLDETA